MAMIFFIGRIDDIHGHDIEFHYNFMAILEEIDTFSWHCEKCSNVISWHIFMGSWEFHGIFTVFSWTVLPVVLDAVVHWVSSLEEGNLPKYCDIESILNAFGKFRGGFGGVRLDP